MARFFALLWAAGTEELQRLRFLLISVSGATLIGAILILALHPSVGVCIWITLIPWLFTAYRLFSIERLIQVQLTDVTLGFAKSLGEILTKKEEKSSFSENDLTKIYLLIISGIFFFQTALFLMLPLYVNFTEGGVTPVILILMIAVVIGIASAKFLAGIFRLLVKVTVVLYVVGLAFVLFPQIGFYANKFVGDTHLVDPRVASVENKIRAVGQENKTVKELAARKAVLEDLEATGLSLEEYQKKLEKEVREKQSR